MMKRRGHRRSNVLSAGTYGVRIGDLRLCAAICFFGQFPHDPERKRAGKGCGHRRIGKEHVHRDSGHRLKAPCVTFANA